MDYREDCEKEFDSFINKTIILSSKEYFRTQMKYGNNEKYILDNEDYCDYLDNHALSNNNDLSCIEHIELSILLQNASSCLSTIEQAAINLLYKQDLKPKEVSEKLHIHVKAVPRIKRRSEEKLRKYFNEGEFFDGK